MKRILMSLLISISFLSGCVVDQLSVSPKISQPQSDLQPLEPGLIDEGWSQQIIKEGNYGFSFYLPPEVQEQPAQGVDSLVGLYRSDELQLTFDYGPYSDSLESRAEMADYKQDWSKIDGFDAKVVTFRISPNSVLPFEYAAAVYFPDVGRNIPHLEYKLSLLVSCKTPQQQEVARKIFQTIQFIH